MSQWKRTNDAANAVSYVSKLVNAGSGKSAQVANNTAMFTNVTADAFVGDQHVGQFGVEAAAKSNTSGEASKVAHAGWQLRRNGVGPILTFAVGADGSSRYANGESVLVHGGDTNAVGIITSNAAGNIASVAVSTGGKFPNTSVMTFAFRREKHVNDIKVTGGSGYHNTDYIVVSNSTTNSVATISTDGSGTFVNAGITITNVGLFANTKANTDVVITVFAANGAASNGSSATLTCNLSTSTGGNVSVTTLGGRAGRVHYETLIAMGSMTSGAGSNTSQLPIT